MRPRLLSVCAALIGAAGCSASLDTGHHGAAGAGGIGSAGTGLGGRSGGFAGAGIGVDGGAIGRGGAAGTTFVGPLNTEVDILFMIDNSSEMTAMQQKLYAQLPTVHTVLAEPARAAQPAHRGRLVRHGRAGRRDHLHPVHAGRGPGPVSVHAALQHGAQHHLHGHHARGRRDLHLRRGHDAELHRPGHLRGVPVHRAPRRQGVRVRASAGVDRPRARRATASRRPARTRTSSAPRRTSASSSSPTRTIARRRPTPSSTRLNGGGQNIANSLGPIANYRCNQFGHLCADPVTGAVISPPLVPPSDAQGTAAAPTLDLTDCTSNDSASGLLTPVSQVRQRHQGAQARSRQPDRGRRHRGAGGAVHRGLGARIGRREHEVRRALARGRAFVRLRRRLRQPRGADRRRWELRRSGRPHCPVRQAFPYGFLGSVCDPSYAAPLSAVAARIGQLIGPP